MCYNRRRSRTSFLTRNSSWPIRMPFVFIASNNLCSDRTAAVPSYATRRHALHRQTKRQATPLETAAKQPAFDKSIIRARPKRAAGLPPSRYSTR